MKEGIHNKDNNLLCCGTGNFNIVEKYSDKKFPIFQSCSPQLLIPLKENTKMSWIIVIIEKLWTRLSQKNKRIGLEKKFNFFTKQMEKNVSKCLLSFIYLDIFLNNALSF